MGRDALDNLDPAGAYQQLTVSTTSTALTVPAGARIALITLEATNGARWRDDGTAPTAAIGMPIAGGAGPVLFQGNLSALRFIRSGAADAVLNVSYYR